MTIAEIAEIFVCVLAVWGFYCILRSVAALFTDTKKVSVGVNYDDEQTVYEIYCEIKAAELLVERKTMFKRPPVILSDIPLSEQRLEELSKLGTKIYINRNIYNT